MVSEKLDVSKIMKLLVSKYKALNSRAPNFKELTWINQNHFAEEALKLN